MGLLETTSAQWEAGELSSAEFAVAIAPLLTAENAGVIFLRLPRRVQEALVEWARAQGDSSSGLLDLGRGPDAPRLEPEVRAALLSAGARATPIAQLLVRAEARLREDPGFSHRVRLEALMIAAVAADFTDLGDLPNAVRAFAESAVRSAPATALRIEALEIDLEDHLMVA